MLTKFHLNVKKVNLQTKEQETRMSDKYETWQKKTLSF